MEKLFKKNIWGERKDTLMRKCLKEKVLRKIEKKTPLPRKFAIPARGAHPVVDLFGAAERGKGEGEREMREV